MKTVQMTLDEDLVNAIDAVSKQLHTNRSASTRMALREALARYNLKQLEHKHRQGYEKDPVTADVMSRDCAINCDHLQTVSRGKIGSLITTLSMSKLADVGKAIRFALDI